MSLAAASQLVDVNGRPLMPLKQAESADPTKRKAMVEAVNSYLLSLGQTQAPVELRARDPFSNHVWVYASAMVTALTAASAPFVVMRESERTRISRTQLAEKAGRIFYPKAGHNRRAFERHLTKSIGHKLLAKAAEPDYEHPFYALLRAPNPFQSGGALFQFTYLWLALRGEIFWIYTDDNGQIVPRNTATQIWPFGPDYFKPVLSAGTRGTLVGWYFTPPQASPMSVTGARIPVKLDEISQFKFANPLSHFRGMSRLTAAAMSIETSLMDKAHQRALLRNNAVPRGVITYPIAMGDKEIDEFMEKWEQRHEGEQNAGQTAMLTGGFQYQQTALSSADMESILREDMSRREVLATMGTPPSVVGLTEVVNYATAQVQDNAFWTRTIVPMHFIVESELDASLFFTETDDVFGMHDISNIDALRAGLLEKVAVANSMCTAALHMPPKVAFEVVGLEVPEYPGDQEAFISGIVSTVKETLAASNEPVATPEPAATVPGESDSKEGEKRRGHSAKAQRRLKAKTRQREFFRLVRKMEVGFKRGYREWVASERARTLARFDKHTKASEVPAVEPRPLEAKEQINVQAILPTQSASAESAKSKTSKPRRKTMKAAFDFTSDELLNVPVFDLTHSRFKAYFDRRADSFGEDVSKTWIRKLRKTLEEGIAEGETIQELRLRIGHVYDLAANSAKALQVARTETANMINGVRFEVFKEHGVTKVEWTSSGDDEVRDSHRVFGSAGPQDVDFNYMSIHPEGGEGVLRYPGDIDGPAGEVINCRCTPIPVE